MLFFQEKNYQLYCICLQTPILGTIQLPNYKQVLHSSQNTITIILTQTFVVCTINAYKLTNTFSPHCASVKTEYSSPREENYVAQRLQRDSR